MSAVPLADLPALARPRRRTTFVRVALAACLLALAAAAVIAAREAGTSHAAVLATGDTGVVALDVSASITGPTYSRISTTLRGIVDANQSIGLVMFSDAAYELIPPRSPASALGQFLRFFEPMRTVSGRLRFPPTPWAGSFRTGTRIAAGLNEARLALRRAGVHHGTVVLVSDLNDSEEGATLAQTVIALRRDGYAIRIVPLFPSPRDLRFFRTLLGQSAFVTPRAFTAGRGADAVDVALPWALLAVGVLLALALAANERWCAGVSLR